MPHHYLRVLITLVIALVAVSPGQATERPFEVFALTSGRTLGPGESFSFGVQVIRHTETCTMCTATSTTCCTGAVTLKFEDVPVGVTACFPRLGGQCDPEITSDSPAALVQATSEILPGTYTLKVRATAKDGPNPKSHSADIPLTLVPFSVHVPSAANLLPGGSQSLALPIERITSSTGAIDLSLESPETGLSGSFNPDPASGNQATLTLNAASSLQGGHYFPTVKATLGNTQRTYDINVAVAPSFSLALVPATLLLAPGASADISVNIERGAGFTAPLTFRLAAPTGFTGTFSTSKLGGTKLRLNAATNVAPGNYHIVVRASGGNITRSVALRVRADKMKLAQP